MTRKGIGLAEGASPRIRRVRASLRLGELNLTHSSALANHCLYRQTAYKVRSIANTGGSLQVRNFENNGRLLASLNGAPVGGRDVDVLFGQLSRKLPKTSRQVFQLDMEHILFRVGNMLTVQHLFRLP